MMSVGKASTVGSATVVLYLFTTLMAAIWGCLTTLAFMGLFQAVPFEEPPPPSVVFECSEEGSYLGETPEGNVVCSTNFTMDDPSVNFIIYDISKTFVTASGPTSDLSLSDSIYQGIFQKTVPDNIIKAFAENNFAAVIFFGILFGVALYRVFCDAKETQSLLMGVFNEANNVFTLIIVWVIVLTPIAVCSLVASAIGQQSDLRQMFSNIAYFIASSLSAMALQMVIVYAGLYAIMTRRNPFWYISKMIPAQTMAFATASSAVTIPTTLASVLSTGLVNETVARFVIPIGATVNMDGAGIYYICACVWLAVINGIDVTVVDFVMLVLITTVGSVGTAPVPASSMVLILTTYNTVFGTTGTPNGFEYILAIDWFMDRCSTVMNVTGDCIVAGVVGKICPIDESLETTAVYDGAKGTDSEENVEKVDDGRLSSDNEENVEKN
jgi:Na+/H+-dicarboxylate symporter